MELASIMNLVAVVLTAVIAIVGSIFGNKYSALKKLLKMVSEAIEDDNLTKDEIQTIYKQAKKLF